MNTNRDQAVQNVIGSAIINLIKDGIFLAVILCTALAIATIVTNLVGRTKIGGGIMLATGMALLLVMGYLVLEADAGTSSPAT